MSYCTEDMDKLKPPVVKQTKESLEIVVNDNLNITRLPPMVEEEESDSTSKHPSDQSQPSMQEEAYSITNHIAYLTTTHTSPRKKDSSNLQHSQE